MTKSVTPKEQLPQTPAAANEVEYPVQTVGAPRRRGYRSTHQLWTRADGFTLSGPRRV